MCNQNVLRVSIWSQTTVIRGGAGSWSWVFFAACRTSLGVVPRSLLVTVPCSSVGLQWTVVHFGSLVPQHLDVHPHSTVACKEWRLLWVPTVTRKRRWSLVLKQLYAQGYMSSSAVSSVNPHLLARVLRCCPLPCTACPGLSSSATTPFLLSESYGNLVPLGLAVVTSAAKGYYQFYGDFFQSSDL